MDVLNEPGVREIWFMKSAQVGWTEILNNVIGYFIDQDPAPMLLVQPTLELAEAWSKDRLAPMLRDTPVLRDAVADVKSKASGNTLLHKKFSGGRLTMAGANAAAGLSSRPVRVVLFDEVDRFPASAGTEGDPISLGKKRTTTFWNRKMLAGSTPTIKGSSRVEVGFESSDQRYYEVPCPQCGVFQRLVWSQVRWPEGKPDEACYVCAHCSAELQEADKLTMLRGGRWHATKPSRGIAGFHISELYSPWSTWVEMVRSFLEAKRLPETFQTWINTSLGETWEDKGETIDAKGLIGRREAYGSDTLPAEVVLVTFGSDVQDNRIETTFWGWGADEQAWRIGHHVLPGDPGQASLWREHDELIATKFKTDDGRTLIVEAGCVDSGGHYTEEVYRYCLARKARRIWAIKGIGGQGRLVWPKRPGRGAKVKVDLWLVGVDTVKDILYARLRKVPKPGPGYIHFDNTTDEVWFEQLTSETVVYRVSQGRKVRLWRPRQTGIRQEGLDCTVYAYAAMIGRGGVKLLNARTAHYTPHVEATPRPAPGEVEGMAGTSEQPMEEETKEADSGAVAPQPRAVVQGRSNGGGWLARRGSWMRK